MWWQVVFWLLLLPLVAVELVIFVRTKRLFWLMYALSIFVYVVAVSYTLDVFDASRNTVILTLVASAVVMALIGRHLGRKPKKRKKQMLTVSVVIAIFMALLFAVNAVFSIVANAGTDVAPVASVSVRDITFTDSGKIRQPGYEGTTLVVRTIVNKFFLPVPAERVFMRICLDEGDEPGTRFGEIFIDETADPNPEVAPFSSREIRLSASPLYVEADQQDSLVGRELLVYHREESLGGRSYVSCEAMGEPEWRIPITQ